MRKIIFVLIAALVVSVSLTGSVESQSLKKAKEKITKKNEKKKSPGAASGNVLAKGLQISWCGRDIKDQGSVSVPGLKNVTLTVKNGKFDLVMPENPEFGDEWELDQHKENFENFDFGAAKVHPFVVMFLKNESIDPDDDYRAKGRCYLGFYIYYSDRDIKGTVNDKPVTLKKGWNIIGDKNNLKVTLMCTG